MCRWSKPRSATGLTAKDEPVAVFETQKESEAAAAVESSQAALEAAVVRLRDSRAIAAELRKHRQQNHFGERIAASMKMIPRGFHP